MQIYSSDNQQTVTVSFFRYPLGERRWGMKQMWVSRKRMQAMPGLKFFKPFGTGGGAGFSIRPDLSTYGILAVWESETHANAFVQSDYFEELRSHSAEYYTIFLHPLSSRGSWSGFADWQCVADAAEEGVMGVITRATIKPRFAWKFWTMVPRTSKDHEGFRGLLFSRGIGEVPLTEQATFSIWTDSDSMKEFAYKTFHAKAITETRKRKGFREEMYTRLKPFRTLGTWGGEDPIQRHLAAVNR
jgi:spheroidene monooxygenase